MLGRYADHNTLDGALEDIARRSFYEDASVTPLGDGRYRVEDDTINGDGYDWTREYGVDWETGPDLVDHSRMHEAFESYTTADHIRYNLPGAVEALELGHVVAFSYQVVYDADLEWSEDAGEYLDSDGEGAGDDTIVGWALVAVDYGEPEQD